MLFVMLLADEYAPACRSMRLGVFQPLRSSVSVPPLSNSVRMGVGFCVKS